MYCGKCGTEITAGAAFCPNCGGRLGTAADVQSNARNKTIGIAAVALVVAALVCGALFLRGKDGQSFFGNSEQDVINVLMDAYLKAEMSNVLEVIPEEILESDDLDGQEIQKIIEDGNESLQYIYSLYPSIFGDDWKMSYQVVTLEEVEKSKLREIRHTYKNYGVELDITAAKRAEIDLNVSGSKDNSSVEINLYLIEVKNSWYVDWTSLQYSL